MKKKLILICLLSLIPTMVNAKELKMYNYNNEQINYDQSIIIHESESQIIDNLQYIMNELSIKYFNNSIIEVKEITNDNIAIINLKGDWSQYFQGSYNAKQTKELLVENALQTTNKIEWIKGVKFLYNDHEINFDHIDLSSVIYRYDNK